MCEKNYIEMCEEESCVADVLYEFEEGPYNPPYSFEDDYSGITLRDFKDCFECVMAYMKSYLCDGNTDLDFTIMRLFPVFIGHLKATDERWIDEMKLNGVFLSPERKIVLKEYRRLFQSIIDLNEYHTRKEELYYYLQNDTFKMGR